MATIARQIKTQVFIVGGGPVGLTLAADLGKRGVSTFIVERNTEVIDHSKVKSVTVRTMEFARQLGFSEAIRNWGFPADFPMTNVFVTTLDGHELGRVEGAPVGEPGAPGFTEFSPEFQVHCPQPWLERIMEAHASSSDNVDIRRNHFFESFVETDDGVTVEVVDITTSERFKVEADYLVAAEGFGGRVSRQIGLAVEERGIDYSIDIEFLTDDLTREHDKGLAVRYTLVGSGGTWGTLMAVDGKRRWRLAVYAVDRQQADDVDPDEMIVKAMGHDFDYTVLRKGPWKRRAAMAASFSRRRVFFVGDAAHVLPPNGGFGMNTGVADAMNLSWKLAGTLDGWGGPELLPSYGTERKPVAQVTLAEAVRDYHRLVDGTASPQIIEDSAAGEEARRRVGGQLTKESVKAWRPLGVSLGYGYPSSPIVSAEPGVYPDFDPQSYEPAVVAGLRAPHVWLGDGRSTLDLFGGNHVLLRAGLPADSTRSLTDAAAAGDFPLTGICLSEEEAGELFGARLTIVRPDGHVAWTGTSPTDDEAQTIIRTISGHGSGSTH